MGIFNSKKSLFLLGSFGVIIIALLSMPRKLVFVNIGNVNGHAYLSDGKVKK